MAAGPVEIDALASEQHIWEHIRPIWEALPPRRRGYLFTSPKVDAPDAHPLTALTGGDRPILVARHGDLARARNAGRTRIALGQHGAGQSYSNTRRAYPGGDDQDDVSLFLVPNEHAAWRTRTRYPRALVEIVGCPKLDGLPHRTPGNDAPVVAISFHWDGQRVAPELRPAWRWYRQHLGLLTRRWTVLGHAHPKKIRDLAGYYRRMRIEVVPSFDEVLRRADVYVCDNSSTIFEFAATGRPVVLLNTPVMRRGQEHGLRFWAAATVGVQVDDPDTLGDAVELALSDPPMLAAARESALDVVYQPRHGGAILAANALQRWA